MKRQKERLHSVIIIGATPSGIAAANKLGELGISVALIDSANDLDQKLSYEGWRLESGIPFNYANRPGLIRILRNPSIKCIMPAKVEAIKHTNQGFRVRLKRFPTFVDSERCTLCGRCEEICPVPGPYGGKAIVSGGRMGLPGASIIDKRRKPICQENCPLGVNAQGYIALTKAGKYKEALKLVRQDNILPGICGRICTHPCETNCRRKELDEPIAIKDIKRFIYDIGDNGCDDAAFNLPQQDSPEKRPEKIAIIGSGPAGLAAAADLARFGYSVTVFEKEKHIGGLLRYGIGQHRLPRNILDQEIEFIKKLGVAFVAGSLIDLSDDLSRLKNEFDAVVLATGTWADRKLDVPGEGLKGVTGCIEFLSGLYRGKIDAINKNVAVIGDGNAAFDLARVLKRLGAKVTLLSWFPMDMIPADGDEVKAVQEENIAIKYSLKAVRFKGKNGRLESIECMPTKPGEPDEKGICWPVLIENAKPVSLKFDRAFIAIGQTGELKNLDKALSFSITKQGYIKTDGSSRTNIKRLYAAGDSVSGPTAVVNAMAAGRQAAKDVHQDICGKNPDKSLTERPGERDFPELPENAAAMKRAQMPERRPSIRSKDFSEVALGLSKSQVLFESERCLQCGVCSQCLECINVCGNIKAIKHDDKETEITEHAGIVIIADPDSAIKINGEDVIRAYGPKTAKPDVNAMVVRGFSAAAKAMVLLGKGSQRPKGHGISFHTPDPGLSSDIRTGVFACRCNDSMGWLGEMTDYLAGLLNNRDIVHVEEIDSACIREGYAKIIRAIREKGITRMVLASCVCCPLNFVCSACTDQRSRLKAALFHGTGISRSMVETCNLRGEVLRYVDKDNKQAMKSFAGLIERSILRSRQLKPLPALARNYNFATAVIGGSEPALTSARTLAEAGMEVFLFGKSGDLLEKGLNYPNINIFDKTSVKAISGRLGEFNLAIKTGEFEQVLQVGAVILGEKSRFKIKYIHQQDLPSKMVEYSAQKAGISGIPFFSPGSTSINGLFLADPPGINISKRIKGEAAAIAAAAVMPRGPRQSKGFTVTINKNFCRGCGRCINVCPYQAVALFQNDAGGWYASVDEAVCKGCGNCISQCPTNAADSPYRDQVFLEQAIKEILAT